MSKSNYIIPIFVPHLGCPHDCIFCNQREITGVSQKIKAKDVRVKIEKHLDNIPKNYTRLEVAFYGGSFTAIDLSYQNELLEVAYNYLKRDKLTGIRLSTRPDYINSDILDNLKSYGVTAIELGVQSLNNRVLSASTRGHSQDDVFKAVNLIKEYDFDLGLQLMPGLPQSTKESDLDTGERIIKLDPDFVRIYPTLVIKNTKLAILYEKEKYQPLSLEEAVDISAKLLKRFREEDIKVIRIGLQPSEGVNKEQVVAGPFHPAFRQLVESKLLLNIIESKISAKNYKFSEIKLIINPKDISNLRGQKNSNIKYLSKKYNLNSIKIDYENNLNRGEVFLKS